MILCSASMKRSGQSATTYALLYTYTDIFRWKSKDELTYGAQINMIHADLLPNAISPSFVFERCDVYVHVIVEMREMLLTGNVSLWKT